MLCPGKEHRESIYCKRFRQELFNNDMTYKLATLQNYKYIICKPGKVAWDCGTTEYQKCRFLKGVNNKTYEYYIDFASKNSIEYVILDEAGQ